MWSQREGDLDVFARAADAVVNGDLETLASLVDADAGLTRARSARPHHATLLHYVSANGVEDDRQRTPPNATAVARFLLDHGADVDALADTYGGGPEQTTMNLLVSSCHPAAAGLQVPLVETLIDYGAAVDGIMREGSPLMTALAFGYIAPAEALARRGARVNNIVTAAALGRADLVKAFLAGDGSLRAGVPLADVRWPPLPRNPAAHIALAFVFACRFGRAEVVELMLARRVDPGVADVDSMTGLHWAAAHGHLPVIELLLAARAPLEVRNRWGGTVLDSTVYFALNAPVPGVNYPTVIDRLLTAGADASVVARATGDRGVDEAMRRHRSAARQ